MNTDYKIIQQAGQSQYWNISKVNDALRVMGPHCDGNSFGVATLQTKDKRAVGVDISIRFDPQVLGKEVTITAYDMAVMDAVYTLYVYHDLQVSDATILRTMYGKRDLDITLEKVRQLHNSIYRLSQITVCVECSEEFRARRIINKDENVTYQGNLLPLEGDRDDYVITGLSPTYQYAQQIGQYATVPSEILQAGDVQNSVEILLLRRYLIKRIAAMRNRRNRMFSKRIALEWWDHKQKRYSGLLPHLGYDPEKNPVPRKKKSTLCQAIRAILTGLQRSNYIAGYVEVRQGQKIIGYEVQLKGGG